MKKITSALLAMMLIVSVLAGCKSKTEVTIKVEKDGSVQLEEAIKTDAETLEALLTDNAEKLGVTMQDSDYGKFVTGMNGYVADAEKKEFWLVSVDDVPSEVGVAEIKIEKGKVYSFKLSNF